ncbi:MAG: PrgI family protein [Patescibacteria group bacterium]
MKTTVVPAQITTVEDRIAGNLTFTQIIMLVIPLITSTAVYVLIPPSSRFSLIKLILIGLQFLVFGTLAIRIKGKILIDWLVILLRFKLRPRIYIFTKNDLASRAGEAIAFTEERKKTVVKETKQEKKLRYAVSLEDQVKIDRLLGNPSLNFRFGLAKKGGIDVSVAASEE